MQYSVPIRLQALGQQGRVVEVDCDGDIKVEVKGQKWTLHPAVLTLLDTDGKTDRQDTHDEKEYEKIEEIENIPTEGKALCKFNSSK